MSAWKTAALGSLVEPAKTWNPSHSAPDEVFDYIDLGAVDQDTKSIVRARKLSCSEAPSRARQLVAKGDVLVSTVRPNLNGVARVPEDLNGATASTGFCVLRSRPALLDSGYIFHWVKSPEFVASMVSKATGASYPAVSDRIILESALPVPPLAQQRRIAAVLDRAEALRAKRRAALAQLDILIQSLFLDLFGDPATNPNKWEAKPLRELVSEFRYGTSNKSQAHGRPALRIPNVVGGIIDLSDLKTVPVDAAEFERLRLINGDVLFVRTNGNPDFVGRCAVFDGTVAGSSGFARDDFVFASYLIRARLAADAITPIFLREFMLGRHGRRELRSRSKTSAGQFNINTENLGAIAVPIPPTVLQREFARSVAAVEKLKTSHRASLGELDALFASLQHRAFRGEL